MEKEEREEKMGNNTKITTEGKEILTDDLELEQKEMMKKRKRNKKQV
jgi:hypothetical protein